MWIGLVAGCFGCETSAGRGSQQRLIHRRGRLLMQLVCFISVGVQARERAPPWTTEKSSCNVSIRFRTWPSPSRWPRTATYFAPRSASSRTRPSRPKSTNEETHIYKQARDLAGLLTHLLDFRTACGIAIRHRVSEWQPIRRSRSFLLTMFFRIWPLCASMCDSDWHLSFEASFDATT